ncbi:eukaryotic translation initiation factor 4B isoform X2 [Petromyzon marinus]|uniref:eukaryotic translation initiation factor 4B isoform X2 n=1 Tax=Petromyzon marinus TaxID=7757 RepID=UPI003F7150E1
MAALGKKKPKKGKTVSLNDFLAEDATAGSVFVPPVRPVNWADETEDFEGEVSTAWPADDGVYKPSVDRALLPTAPRAARAPSVDMARLPAKPPYTAFLGNLPYDVTEESIFKFFTGLKVSAVRLPREASNSDRLKGFGYAEFDDIESLMRALALNDEMLRNRRVRVDIADQTQDRDDRGGLSRDRDWSREDKTDNDWRSRSSNNNNVDDFPRRNGDQYGDRDRMSSWGRDRYEPDRERFRDRERSFGPRRDVDHYRDSQDRYDDRDSGYDDRRSSDRGPVQRPKLNLKPRSTPKEEGVPPPPAPATQKLAFIFGGAKPVDTAAREREVEERLKREQEEMERRLSEQGRLGKPEWIQRERHPSWRSDDDHLERRPTSDTSETGRSSRGASATSSASARGPRVYKESDVPGDNEVFTREDGPLSPATRSPRQPEQQPQQLSQQRELPQLVPQATPQTAAQLVPAPPPKENAWVKRCGSAKVGPTSPTHHGATTELPLSQEKTQAHKLANSVSSNKMPSTATYSRGVAVDKDLKPLPDGSRTTKLNDDFEGKPDATTGRTEKAGVRAKNNLNRVKGRGRGIIAVKKDPDRKESRKERESRLIETKKYDEPEPLSFSSVSKFSALGVDGDSDYED